MLSDACFEFAANFDDDPAKESVDRAVAELSENVEHYAEAFDYEPEVIQALRTAIAGYKRDRISGTAL